MAPANRDDRLELRRVSAVGRNPAGHALLSLLLSDLDVERQRRPAEMGTPDVRSGSGEARTDGSHGMSAPCSGDGLEPNAGHASAPVSS